MSFVCEFCNKENSIDEDLSFVCKFCNKENSIDEDSAVQNIKVDTIDDLHQLKTKLKRLNHENLKLRLQLANKVEVLRNWDENERIESEILREEKRYLKSDIKLLKEQIMRFKGENRALMKIVKSFTSPNSNNGHKEIKTVNSHKNVSNSSKIRNMSEAKKKNVAGKQFYKCANNPNSKLSRLENYECPLWSKTCENKGIFDESGYEIDHITEHSLSFDDSIENLQALCKMCHAVKTKRFMIK